MEEWRMRDLYELKLADILPSSIASDPQVGAASEALDQELQSVSYDTREALIVSRIDELSEPVLDLLAWQWHVDFYEPTNNTLEVKRNLVKTSILAHMRKGTKWAVQGICSLVFGEMLVEPWYEYGGGPYWFRISTEVLFSSLAAWEKLFLALDATKSVRDGVLVSIHRETNCKLYYGHGSLLSGRVTADLDYPKFFAKSIIGGIGSAIMGTIRIPSAKEVTP
jgi:phage tail P2-like protein